MPVQDLSDAQWSACDFLRVDTHEIGKNIL